MILKTKNAAKIEWSFKKDATSPYFVNVLKSLAFIEKDTKRFPNTQAYAQWDYDAATDSSLPNLIQAELSAGLRVIRWCRRKITFSPHIQNDRWEQLASGFETKPRAFSRSRA